MLSMLKKIINTPNENTIEECNNYHFDYPNTTFLKFKFPIKDINTANQAMIAIFYNLTYRINNSERAIYLCNTYVLPWLYRTYKKKDLVVLNSLKSIFMSYIFIHNIDIYTRIELVKISKYFLEKIILSAKNMDTLRAKMGFGYFPQSLILKCIKVAKNNTHFTPGEIQELKMGLLAF